MADGTHIEWTEATWNPITGCSVLSPGCTNCYAMQLAGTRLAQHPSRAGLTRESGGRPKWTGEVRFNEQWLDQPLRWKRQRMIFVCAHGDLFHEAVPDEWIDRVMEVVARCPDHTFQVLTKRAARMREYFTRAHSLVPRRSIGHSMIWPNLWLGVSVEDQQRADERIPDLLATPAAVRWISAEPLLGPLDLERICLVPAVPGSIRAGIHINALQAHYVESGLPYIGEWDVSGPLPPNAPALALDWIVAGGESGAGARPMHPDWARSLRDQCAEAGVPFFFKQWGEFGPDTGPDEDLSREGYRRDRVMEGAGPCAAWTGERWHFADDGYAMPLDLPGDCREWVYRLGKKRAGRLLDGVEHNGLPEAA